MLVASVVISGVLMLIYEAADFIEGILDEVPLQFYKIFYVTAYLISILMILAFALCNKDQFAFRILIGFSGIYWLIRFIIDWFGYKRLEEAQDMDAENDEKKDE